MIESAKIFILGLLFSTILQDASGSLLNIINVEYSESKFKESGVENGINILSIVLKYTTTDPAKIQATWMKELDDGTLPIYVGDREFITWENKFSIDENVTEVQCYIEYLAPQNPGDDVRSDLNIPDFGTGLAQLNLWISVESNTIVKVLGLDQESKWGSHSSYFSLTKNQDETIGLNDHNTVLRTDLEYSINSNSLNGNGEKGSWFYNTKYGMFSRFAQLPPPDATRLKDGANGTSIQYFAKDSKVQNTLVQEKEIPIIPCQRHQLRHKIFVYGTLKKNQPNYYRVKHYLEHSHIKFIAEGITSIPHPLVIATDYRLPFLCHAPLHGKVIHGEVYEMDDEMMEFFDEFEGHPRLYCRDKISVKIASKAGVAGPLREVDCWTYFLKDYPPELLELKQAHAVYDSTCEGMEYKVPPQCENPGNIYDALLEECKTIVRQQANHG